MVKGRRPTRNEFKSISQILDPDTSLDDFYLLDVDRNILLTKYRVDY